MHVRNLVLLLTVFTSAWSHAQVGLPSYDFSKMHEIYEKVFKLSRGTYRSDCSLSHHTTQEMQSFFQKGLNKIVNVNKWDSLVGIPGQSFQLYKVSGTQSHQGARKGDYIEIKLPADPTNRSYWVRVESFYFTNLSPYEMAFSMVLKPTSDPARKKSSRVITDHFFTNAATNTLNLKLYNNTLQASVVGDHEEPNFVQAPSWAEGFANKAIVRMSWGLNLPEVGQIGFQRLVWHKLTKSIVDCQE